LPNLAPFLSLRKGERKSANSPNLAPFLSLRRGERWRREAATEWGKALRQRVPVASEEQPLAPASYAGAAIKPRRFFGLS